MSTQPNDRIVWIDCEMTGLDPAADVLLEVAAVVTDSELTPLDAGIEVVIRPPAGATAAMEDVVVQMHTASGLLDVLDAGTTLADAQAKVLDYVKKWVPEPRKAPLAGTHFFT